MSIMLWRLANTHTTRMSDSGQGSLQGQNAAKKEEEEGEDPFSKGIKELVIGYSEIMETGCVCY